MEWLVAGAICLVYFLQLWAVFEQKSEPRSGRRRLSPDAPITYQHMSPRPWEHPAVTGAQIRQASQILQRWSVERVNWRKEGF